MKSNERKTRKVLVPLATLAVAAAVAVGSGATFTSTSHSKIVVTSGKVVHSNTSGNDITLGNPVDASTTLSTDDETTITFVVSLSANADDLDQKAKAGATYTFSTTPVDGQTGLSGIWN